MEDTTQTPPSLRKRRVRKKRPRERTTALNSGRLSIARRVHILMLVCGALYCIGIFYQVCTAVGPIQGVSLGMEGQDVRYRLGSPLTSAQTPAVWNYAVAGNILTLTFGADQRVSKIACAEGAAAQLPCADILGVEIHTTEADLKLRLGPPDREGYDHGEKLVAYERLGVTFRLHQSRVIAIEERSTGTIVGRLLETFWAILP